MAVLMVLNEMARQSRCRIRLPRRLTKADRGPNMKQALASLGDLRVLQDLSDRHACDVVVLLARSYWTAIVRDIRSVVISPPHMVDALARGPADGLVWASPGNAVQRRRRGRTVAVKS